jgi:hypothetical protein
MRTASMLTLLVFIGCAGKVADEPAAPAEATPPPAVGGAPAPSGVRPTEYTKLHLGHDIGVAAVDDRYIYGMRVENGSLTMRRLPSDCTRQPEIFYSHPVDGWLSSLLDGDDIVYSKYATDDTNVIVRIKKDGSDYRGVTAPSSDQVWLLGRVSDGMLIQRTSSGSGSLEVLRGDGSFRVLVQGVRPFPSPPAVIAGGLAYVLYATIAGKDDSAIVEVDLASGALRDVAPLPGFSTACCSLFLDSKTLVWAGTNGFTEVIGSVSVGGNDLALDSQGPWRNSMLDGLYVSRGRTFALFSGNGGGLAELRSGAWSQIEEVASPATGMVGTDSTVYVASGAEGDAVLDCVPVMP